MFGKVCLLTAAAPARVVVRHNCPQTVILLPRCVAPLRSLGASAGSFNTVRTKARQCGLVDSLLTLSVHLRLYRREHRTQTCGLFTKILWLFVLSLNSRAACAVVCTSQTLGRALICTSAHQTASQPATLSRLTKHLHISTKFRLRFLRPLALSQHGSAR